MTLHCRSLISDLERERNPKKAKILRRFFKTGPGEYGEGDVFWGITVPTQRTIAKKYAALPLSDVHELLASDVHEHRFTALCILVNQFKTADLQKQKAIAQFYLSHIPRVNNWDLVDASAPYILGVFVSSRPRKVLYTLARSRNVWKRRVAILATFAFIKDGDADDALRIARILIDDDHDLIHKAVGWMLREVGKQCSKQKLEAFLKTHAGRMPRTMLRYAIERFPEYTRKQYLEKVHVQLTPSADTVAFQD